MLCAVNMIAASFDSCALLQMYVGGVIEKDLPHLPGRPNFRGCLENVFINGANVIKMTQDQEPDIRLANGKVAQSIMHTHNQ